MHGRNIFNHVTYCLSSAMLRATIDLRQPMFLLKFTEDRDRFRQGSRNTRFPRFRIQDRTPPMAIEVAEVDPCEALAPTACLRPQRSCRVVWASVKAAYRSSQAVRPRQRHRYRESSPSLPNAAVEWLPCERFVLFIQSTRRHIVVAERRASLRVCA